MDKKTMGAFLSALRKANGYTQQEVADRLNVSNKTVSKWERDEGCPEIMMLPAIAELYDVTVDELLRGERTVREETHFKEEKTEKQAKYLFSKAQSKFNNLSVIAVSLGVIAAVLSYLLYVLPYGHVSEWVGIFLVILLMSASVIIEIIAFNNFKLNFGGEESLIAEKEINNGKRKALMSLGAVVCLAIISVIGIVFLIANVIDTFVMIPVAVLLGGAVACLIYWLGGKQMGLDKADKAELSPEFIKYRRKHINVTAIVVAGVMAVSFILPFVEEYLDYLCIQSYSFIDVVEYGVIESEETAENEYYKLKNFYENGETLYVTASSVGDYLWMQKYTATATHESFKNGKTAYRNYDVVKGDYQGTAFGSTKEMKEFEYNHCWDMEMLDITKVHSHVSFDDETLTVSWRSEYDVAAYAIDNLPAYVLVGSCIAIVGAVVSYIVYYRKKKVQAV